MSQPFEAERTPYPLEYPHCLNFRNSLKSPAEIRRLRIAQSRSAETVVRAAYRLQGDEHQGGSQGQSPRRKTSPLLALSALAALAASFAARSRILMRRISRSEGLMETLVTLLATVIFGLGWATIETRSFDANLRAANIAEPPIETESAADSNRAKLAGSKTGYAATDPAKPAASLDDLNAFNSPQRTQTAKSLYGAPDSQWTDEPPARSRR